MELAAACTSIDQKGKLNSFRTREMASHSPSKMAKSLLLLCGIQAGFAFTHGPSPVAGLAGKRVRAAASSRMPFRRIPLLRMQEMGGGGLEEPSPLRRMEVDGPVGGAKPERYTLYPERWTQLAILSILALLSDWACFATAGGPQTWISQAISTFVAPSLEFKFVHSLRHEHAPRLPS